MAKAIEAGIPKLRIEEAAARTQAQIDSGRQTITGVNKFRLDEEEDVPVLKVDNYLVRKQQIEKLERLRAERDPKALKAALDALAEAARTGEGNLLALSVDAARAKATVGEISDAIETAFNRHVARIKTVKGVYGEVAGDDDRVKKARSLAEAFEARFGEKPKILIAKLGQDGHDRGQKVVASAYADLGWDVVVGPLFQTPEEAADLAVAEKVHAAAASSLAAGHLTLVPELRNALGQRGRDDILVVVGGVIPPDDEPVLRQMGAAAVFPPGTVIADSALVLLERMGMELEDN